jgi:hypothetical protein
MGMHGTLLGCGIPRIFVTRIRNPNVSSPINL